jgi:Protein of unknown function (DUF3089)
VAAAGCREACRGLRVALAALATSLAAAAALASPAAAAQDATVWLCRPGLAHDPCTPGMATTHLANDGSVVGVDSPPIDRHPKVDCFYLYPTVSDDPTANSDLSVDPEERSVALYQAARYSQECRVYAPMYRQVTLTQLNLSLLGLATTTPAMERTAYESALAGWKDYLRNYNLGRPFVLIGHSQGSIVLRRLIRRQIDDRPVLRHRLVSAILLGGNVVVRKGRRIGGDFEHIAGCRSRTDLHCVMAWSTFNEPVPPDAFFGRPVAALGGPSGPGYQILCDYPGARQLRSILPTAPFAPGTVIGALTPLVGYPPLAPNVTTPWREYDHAYIGHCSGANGAHVLQLTDEPGAPHLNAIPSPQWGLHLVDTSIALGNLTAIARAQERAYFRSAASRR